MLGKKKIKMMYKVSKENKAFIHYRKKIKRKINIFNQIAKKMMTKKIIKTKLNNRIILINYMMIIWSLMKKSMTNNSFLILIMTAHYQKKATYLFNNT